jgi:(1->4)-alpha-D-glucan 1-alpha-D-glucosylmutase
MATVSDVSTWGRQIADAVLERLSRRPALPEATYRLQFQGGQFGFRDAARIASYLADLGISHVYASPYLKTSSAASHGYAVVDYSSLHSALGGEEEYRAMVRALSERRVGQILDIVPNHMSAAPGENLWWDDVLENGPSSPYAHAFDIDWRPVKEELRDKVLLPLLGDQYGRVLESGELRLEYHEGAFSVHYFQARLPLDPSTYPIILTHRLDELRQVLPADSEDLLELESIRTALEYLPKREDTAPDRVAERQREKEIVKSRLRRLSERSRPVAEHIQRALKDFNGTKGDPHSFDLLDKLLDAQAYRLSHWKAASDEINYRRFFDVNDLAAVCMEEATVFEKAHRFVFDLLVRGDLAGLRLDHIDGLFDPLEYLWRLQWGYVRALGQAEYGRWGERRSGADGDWPEWRETEPWFLRAVWERLGGICPWVVFPQLRPPEEVPPAEASFHGAARPRGTAPPAVPLYVVVEKILGPEEPLPDEWPVAGTTGYDFLNFVNRLFVDPQGLRQMAKTYDRFVQREADFREVAYRSKSLILRTSMSSELLQLAHRLNRISEKDRRSRDFTLNTLRTTLREIIACFPIYRTYIRRGKVSERDREVIRRTVAQAKRRNPAMDAGAFDFVRDVLLLEQPAELDEAGRREREYFLGRFQQVTSPVIAKGVEDTAFYRYYPLASLNEVGGDPSKSAISVEGFHQENLAQRRNRPRSLIATTTHDTKRSEDVRARINVLSELPHYWRKAVNRWARLNARHRRDVEGQPAPSRNDEYLFYQTLLGVWPLEPPDDEGHRQLIQRMQTYMWKAIHEAKERTSWISPHAEYDEAVSQFVAATLSSSSKNRFLAEFRAFHERIVDAGLYTALSQVVLKFLSPGVPDLYQGQEIWDFSLVDPDNRRPVDFELRRRMLADLERQAGRREERLLDLARRLGRSPRDPRLKLFVTRRCLEFRRRHAELFHTGQYLPIAAEGARAEHVCAFAWREAGDAPGGRWAIVVAPRLLARLTGISEGAAAALPPLGEVWRDTCLNVAELPGRPFKNLFTGRTCRFEDSRLPLSTILADFPVAVLSG